MATNAPTATFNASGVGGHMTLGYAYTTDSSGNFSISQPGDIFASSDQFAYVIQLD